MTRLKKEHILIAGAELEKSQGVREEKECIRKGLEEPEVAPWLLKYLHFVVNVTKFWGLVQQQEHMQHPHFRKSPSRIKSQAHGGFQSVWQTSHKAKVAFT